MTLIIAGPIFFRAVLANELSVKALWKFLEKAVPDAGKRYDNQWWISILPTNRFGQKFQQDAIMMKPPQEWDMSILALAILKCSPSISPSMFSEEKQRQAIERLRDNRNKLCHTCPSLYDNSDIERLFIDLDGLFTDLLGESGVGIRQELKEVRKRKS